MPTSGLERGNSNELASASQILLWWVMASSCVPEGDSWRARTFAKLVLNDKRLFSIFSL